MRIKISSTYNRTKVCKSTLTKQKPAKNLKFEK